MARTPMPKGDVRLGDGRVLRLQRRSSEVMTTWKIDNGFSVTGIIYPVVGGGGFLHLNISDYDHFRTPTEGEVGLVRQAFFGENPVEITRNDPTRGRYNFISYSISDKEGTLQRYKRLIVDPWIYPS